MDAQSLPLDPTLMQLFNSIAYLQAIVAEQAQQIQELEEQLAERSKTMC